MFSKRFSLRLLSIAFLTSSVVACGGGGSDNGGGSGSSPSSLSGRITVSSLAGRKVTQADDGKDVLVSTEILLQDNRSRVDLASDQTDSNGNFAFGLTDSNKYQLEIIDFRTGQGMAAISNVHIFPGERTILTINLDQGDSSVSADYQVEGCDINDVEAFMQRLEEAGVNSATDIVELRLTSCQSNKPANWPSIFSEFGLEIEEVFGTPDIEADED